LWWVTLWRHWLHSWRIALGWIALRRIASILRWVTWWRIALRWVARRTLGRIAHWRTLTWRVTWWRITKSLWLLIVDFNMDLFYNDNLLLLDLYPRVVTSVAASTSTARVILLEDD
jgi:hypothetical protein